MRISLLQARMSAAPAEPAPTHVIWSEASAPLFLANDPDRLRLVGNSTPPGGLTLLGTLRTTPPGSEPFQVWNSMLAIDDEGRVVDSYDKAHLVPFGEFMPLRSILGLGSVAGGIHRFLARPRCPDVALTRTAAGRTADLLRGDLPRVGGRRLRSSGLAVQSDQRWLVRHLGRAIPALGRRASARGGGRSCPSFA